MRNTELSIMNMISGRPCSICGGDAIPPEWGDRSGPICKACHPEYRKQYFDAFDCNNCRQTFYLEKGKPAMDYCPYCESLRYVCDDCGCGNLFFRYGESRGQSLCPLCSQLRKERAFQKTIPLLYRATETLKLPFRKGLLVAWAWLMHPDADKPGLFLWGASGAGKSRTQYLLASKAINLGKTAKVIKGQEFGREIIQRTKPDGSGDLAEYLNELLWPNLLCVDEVDKIRQSPRVEAEFFSIFEDRLARGARMVFTSNVGFDKFAAGFSAQNRDPVKRRLYEFFHPVKFQLQPANNT